MRNIITVQPVSGTGLASAFRDTFKISTNSVKVEVTEDNPGMEHTNRKFKVIDMSDIIDSSNNEEAPAIMWANESVMGVGGKRNVFIYSLRGSTTELVRVSYKFPSPTMLLELRTPRGELLGEFTFEQKCSCFSIGATYVLKTPNNEQSLLMGKASVCCCCCCIVCQMLCCMSKLSFPVESPVTGNKICTGYVTNGHSLHRQIQVEFVPGNVSETDYVMALAVFIGVLDYEIVNNSRRNEVHPT